MNKETKAKISHTLKITNECKRRGALKNKIAKLLNHGLGSAEIAQYISPCTTQQLIEIITDYQVADLESHLKEANDLLEKVADSYEDAGCDGCGTISKEVINEVRQFVGWKEI